MDYSKFYFMRIGTWQRMLHFQPCESFGINEDSRAVHSAVEIPKGIVRFKRFSGRKYGDFHNTTYANIQVMSKRINNILRKKGFKGWKPLPAEILEEDGTIRTDYHLMTIVGRCGQIDHDRRERFVFPPYFEGAPVRKGLRGFYFVDDEWDGSDIFCPPGTGYIFITESVKNVLVAEKVQNIRMTRLDQFEMDNFIDRLKKSKKQ